MDYTTRQVSGMTGIPVVTMQRYIKTYPEGFSDRAKIPARGRRYTPRDIAIILLIRSLLKQRKSPGQIHEEIQSYSPGSLPIVSPLHDMESMLDFSNQVDKRLKDMNYFAHQLRRTRKAYTDHTIALFDFVRKQNEVIEEQAKRIQDLEIQLGRRRKLTAPPKITGLKKILYDIEDILMPWEKIPKPPRADTDSDSLIIVPVESSID